MRIFLIIAFLCMVAGCGRPNAEALPEIPPELKPINSCDHEIKHIAGHKILVFKFWNGNGGQFFALDLGLIKEKGKADE